MARISTASRQASGDRLAGTARTSPSRAHGFNAASTFARISSRPLPEFAHSQSSPASPSSLATQAGSPTATSSNMSFNSRHQRSVSDTGVALTPTTRRPSKAKKGKRVHNCDFEGCNKVFTRAEHLRRHQFNHNPKALYRCEAEGCGKTFNRKDLVTRHMSNRHSGMLNGRIVNRGDYDMQSNAVTMGSESRPLMSPVSLDHRSSSVPAVSHDGNLMSIGSLVQPRAQHHLGNGYGLPVWGGPDRDLVRGEIYPELPQINTDDAMMYSSPGSSRSPSSDVPPFQFPQHTPIMDQSYSESFYHPQVSASPLTLTSSVSDWTPVEGATAPQMLPVSLEGDILQTVALSVPIPFSGLDGDEWYAMRRELASAPGVVSGTDGMEIIDTAKWQDCFQCYWKHFHPLFPIVHRPTFFSTKPSPLMSGAMVAIGSQYDTRPNAKEYSLALLEACLNLLTKRNPITIRSRISDIQAVFLLEYLSKYRSRRADVAISPRFRSLYGSFIRNHHWASRNPLAVFNTLSGDQNQEDLGRAYRFWVENETRRRVLQAAFLFDVQQFTLFQQPLVFIQPIGTPRLNCRKAETIDLPFPCQEELWECRGIQEWAQYARATEPLTLSSATQRVIRHDDMTLALDPFRSNLILSYAMLTNMGTVDLERALEPFIERVKHAEAEKETTQNSQPCGTSTKTNHTLFAYHALLAAYRTPLKDLLMVSGESWLFNRKIADQAEFEHAKERLRNWVSDSDKLKKAIWHAVRVLEYAVDDEELSDTLGPTDSNSGLCHGLGLFSDDKDCVAPLDVLGSYDNGGNQIEILPHNPQGQFPTPDCFPKISAEPPRSVQAGPVTSLHANWVLYVCALVCWAYGVDASTSKTTISSLTPPSSPRTFLSTYTSLAPSWSQISRESIPDYIRRDTSGLLDYIRTRWLQPGRMGGLLNEGEMVLQRLVEHNLNGALEKKTWEF
ncbi:hypothetical protein AJ79_10108 [Helicocarpus griseus UAMH5409]|uniref:C2H2-type domain-containing protein n=1 Tax=Helicocarpus griseus UAMH5409 TaxID=1447875 RepID=A0A2B7WFI5_9EURO|nr:hypothetical protein AJ79_10108 [Helicocarpus griseus UAMH5409]